MAQPAIEVEAQPKVGAAAQPAAAPDEEPTVASAPFTTTKALLATVEDGSVGHLSGKYLIRLVEGWIGFWAEIINSDPAFLGLFAFS